MNFVELNFFDRRCGQTDLILFKVDNICNTVLQCTTLLNKYLNLQVILINGQTTRHFVKKGDPLRIALRLLDVLLSFINDNTV